MSVTISAPASPYKGLAPFEDSDVDAMLFFGREAESAVIAANLIASRITVLYGPSGVGKSSVLRAGVAHRLRQEREAAVIVFASWAGDPVAALIEAAEGSGDSLPDALADAADRAGGDLYLILDQFEECFLYHKGGGAFAAQLAQVLRRGGLRVNVLIGMREDALARLDVLKASIPNLLTNRLRLERLDRRAATSAIIGPVDRYNELVPPEERVEIEPELELSVLDQVTAGRVELATAGRGVPLSSRDEDRIEAPYLQLVLTRLWDVERSRGSRVLHLATLAELGGAEHIVEDHLERAMAELSPREKGAAAAMYNFLVTPSGTKIAHGIRDLAGYAAVDEDEATGVLRRLTTERIVRASSENGPSSTRYEIFHDVLADAVVAWRTRYEAQRALETERIEHHRRQRRLLAIFAAALVAFAVMAAIAVYALAERSNAQHQASVAEAQKVKADRFAARALRSQARERTTAKKAKRAQRIAERERRNADKSATAAKRSAARERAAKLDALAQKARAEGNEAKAREFGRQAELARRNADRQRVTAVKAQALATSQKRVVTAQKLEADARALLGQDPEASVRQALRAVAAARRAGLGPAAVEDTLRAGLLALRVEAVLPVGGSVQVVRFSPDGSLLLVAGRGGARLYDLKGRLVHRLRPVGRVTDAAFSPNGRLVAAAESGGAVHLWDVQSGAETVGPLRHREAVLSIAFSADGSLIATGSADGTARVWTVAGGLPVGLGFPHPPGISRGDDVQMVSFSPDGRQLLTVGGDRFVRLFDIARNEKVREFDLGFQANVARFSHDGTLVAAGGATPSNSEAVRVWDARSGILVKALQGTGRVADLVFSRDDKLIATANGNDTVARVYSLETGSSDGVVTVHRSGVESVAFGPFARPNGPSILTTGRDGRAYIARADSGFVQAALLGHKASVNDGAYSPDGRHVLTGSDDGDARLWDALVDNSGPWPPAVPSPVGDGAVNVFAVTVRGLAVSIGTDNVARLVLLNGRSIPLSAGAKDASFSSDGQFVITAGRDGTARIWRTDGTPLTTFGHGNEVLNRARFSANGQLVVTAGEDGFAIVWTRAGAQLLKLKQGSPVNDARFSRNGKLLVTAGDDGTAVIWRVADGRRLQTLTGHVGAVISAVFNRSGSLVATGGSDLTGRVWSVRSGAALAVLRVHQGSVNDVAFSNDGRWLATGGPGAAGIWETSRHGRWPSEPTYMVRPPTARINDVVFSSRGWRLIIGSRDGVHTYDCKLCARVSQLVSIAHARLSEILRAKP